MSRPNPYAPPVADEAHVPGAGLPEGGLWNAGGDVVVCHKMAPWPDRCVRCNAPAQGYRLKRQLSWHPGWVYLTFLAGALIYVILALAIRKTALLHVGLCPRHRRRRRIGMLVGWLGVLATLATCSASIKYNPGAAVGLGFLGFIVFMIVGVVLSQVVRPKKIDLDYAWVKCGPDFVRSLPSDGYAPR